jgi:hypothetical protein
MKLCRLVDLNSVQLLIPNSPKCTEFEKNVIRANPDYATYVVLQ